MKKLKPRWLSVWQRNFRVWMKLMLPSLIGNFIDPLIYLLAFGYGLGQFVKTMGNTSYLSFIAPGVVCMSAAQAASFESLYSVYVRMSRQKTWDVMLAAPLNVGDIVMGEAVWSATKGLINATAILIVATFLGLTKGSYALLTLPIVFLMSCAFSTMGLVVTAYAKGYDFFNYYLTLVLTPMVFLSGAFFPLNAMPAGIQLLAKMFPLYHAIELVRPLMLGEIVKTPILHLSVLFLYALGAYAIAVTLLKRRVIN